MLLELLLLLLLLLLLALVLGNLLAKAGLLVDLLLAVVLEGGDALLRLLPLKLLSQQLSTESGFFVSQLFGQSLGLLQLGGALLLSLLGSMEKASR